MYKYKNMIVNKYHSLKKRFGILFFQKNCFHNEQIVLDIPHANNCSVLNSAILYKYYWFAENLQYYPSLKMASMTLPLHNEQKKVLTGGLFAKLTLNFTYDEYFTKIIKSPERALIRKAIKNGFTVREIHYDDYIKEIQAINVSKESRGGRSMGKDYVNVRKRDEVVKPYNPEIYTYGCFSESGELVAYYLFEHFTNFYHTVKGIGHSEYLNMGIMNYLFAYSVSELSKLRKNNCLIYGRMDNDGLSRFKKNVGCKPVLIVYRGYKKEFRALDYFMSHYVLHDDSALNYVHEYILSNRNPT